ncbi:c-type cytochrome [Roseimaritima ulvae]|nr:c-type cytochrome [Roseimaritima ulvae]
MRLVQTLRLVVAVNENRFFFTTLKGSTMKWLSCVSLLSVVWFGGCMSDPKSGEGFSLPDGNAEQGRATFTRLQCQACHTVSGVEFEEAAGDAADQMIALGGETTRVRTYGDLVTSIINPSHRFATGYEDEQIKAGEESRMPIYNDKLTVTELTDLVAFLQQHYELKTYPITPYTPYYH